MACNVIDNFPCRCGPDPDHFQENCWYSYQIKFWEAPIKVYPLISGEKI